ncbi:hypothetical protein LBMAG42_25860 [Deltaproteobacteria bacterium]|nr:hypothetical protein LBMAG42_25860 [Deltaproteobacteria bacterium]
MLLVTDPWARALTRERNGRAWWALWLALPASGLATFERLYAYFRWADDVVDAPGRRQAEVALFVERQMLVVAGRTAPKTPGEHAIRAVLDGQDGVRLLAVVEEMLAALRFDTDRGPAPIPADALLAQAARVGGAFVNAVWICAGEPGALPVGVDQLAEAACLAHVIRDREIDRALGYENRPASASGAPVDEAEWIRALTADADARFGKGETSLSAPMRWRTRWLLRQYAERYRRALHEASAR